MNPAAAWILVFEASKIIFSRFAFPQNILSLSMSMQRLQHSENNWPEHRNRSQACAWRTQGAECSEYYSLSSRALIQIITKATWVRDGGSLRRGVTWLNLNRVIWGKKPSNSRNGNGNCNHLLSCHACEKTEQPEQIPTWLVNEISANPYTVFVYKYHVWVYFLQRRLNKSVKYSISRTGE